MRRIYLSIPTPLGMWLHIHAGEAKLIHDSKSRPWWEQRHTRYGLLYDFITNLGHWRNWRRARCVIFVTTIYMVCHQNDLRCDHFHDLIMQSFMLLEIGFTMAVMLQICCHIRANVYIISVHTSVLCILIRRKDVYNTNLVIGLNAISECVWSR